MRRRGRGEVERRLKQGGGEGEKIEMSDMAERRRTASRSVSDED